MTVKNIANQREKWLLIALILLQLAVAVFFGCQKESWHLDEIYTQGLSNSYYKPFLNSEDLMEWKDKAFYREYLTVQADERFRYDSVFYNETFDLHPPMYTFVVHTVSSMTPDYFSKWQGIGINMFFFIPTQILLYSLALRRYKNPKVGLLVCGAFGSCALTLGTLMFIRMYAMLTLFAVLFAWIHGEMIRKNHQSAGMLAGVFAVCITGFLTQYLFLVFAFFGYLAYGIHLLRRGRRLDLVVYSAVMVAALALATLFFPTWTDLLLKGGLQSFPAYHSWALSSFFVKMLFFLYYLIRGLFGSVYIAIALGFLILAVKLYRIRVKGEGRRGNFLRLIRGEAMLSWVFWTSLGSCLMILYISPFNDAYRYLSFMVPLWILYLVPAAYQGLAQMRWTKARPAATAAVIIIALSVFSYIMGGVDYLYGSRAEDLDARIASTAEYPAICVTGDNINMTIVVPLMEKHTESCYVPPQNIGMDTKQMLDEIGALGSPFVVYLPDWVLEERSGEDLEYLNEIAEACGYTSYVKIFDAEESGLRTSAYLIK